MAFEESDFEGENFFSKLIEVIMKIKEITGSISVKPRLKYGQKRIKLSLAPKKMSIMLELE